MIACDNRLPQLRFYFGDQLRRSQVGARYEECVGIGAIGGAGKTKNCFGRNPSDRPALLLRVPHVQTVQRRGFQSMLSEKRNFAIVDKLNVWRCDCNLAGAQ